MENSLKRITLNVYTKQEGSVVNYFLGTNGENIGYIHKNNEKVQGHYEGGTINTTSDKLEEVYQFVENGIKKVFDEYGIDVKITSMFG